MKSISAASTRSRCDKSFWCPPAKPARTLQPQSTLFSYTAHALLLTHCAPARQVAHPYSTTLNGLVSRYGIACSERLWWEPLSQQHVWRRRRPCADAGVPRCASHARTALARSKLQPAIASSGAPCGRSNDRHRSRTTADFASPHAPASTTTACEPAGPAPGATTPVLVGHEPQGDAVCRACRRSVLARAIAALSSRLCLCLTATYQSDQLVPHPELRH